MLDIQVNGGNGLLFNDITTLDEFLRIELKYLKDAKCFIIPTFITDSNEKLKKFVDLVLQRIKFNEKQYTIGDNNIILPELFGVHFEGPFITNKGTHPQQYLKEFNDKNVNEFIEIVKPLKNLKIYLTIAPELLLKNFINSKILIKKLKDNFDIILSAGHTKITKYDFKNIQNRLGEDKFRMLTHFHNAMLEGHLIENIEGIPSYLIENNYDGYIGLITDGQHTGKGELLPTLLNFYDKICVVSDGTSVSCCKIYNNTLYEMGGNVSVVEQKNNELPSFFWTDFSKDKNFHEKDLEKVYEWYIKGEVGYKTLAGSAVTIRQCYEFLKNLNIEEEISKSKLNSKSKKWLEIGLRKNNLIEDVDKIRSFINNYIDNMFFENPIKALKIDENIRNYKFLDNKVYKNDKIFIDFNLNFDGFLNQIIPDQTILKEKLLDNLRKFINI